MSDPDSHNEGSDPDLVGWSIVVIAWASGIIAVCVVLATIHYLKTV